MVVTSDLHEPPDARVLRELGETWHTHTLCGLPEFQLVVVLAWLVSRVLAGSEDDGFETGQLLAGEGRHRVVTGQQRKIGDERVVGKWTASRDRDVVAVFAQFECGVRADHAGAADNQNFHDASFGSWIRDCGDGWSSRRSCVAPTRRTNACRRRRGWCLR